MFTPKRGAQTQNPEIQELQALQLSQPGPLPFRIFELRTLAFSIFLLASKVWQIPHSEIWFYVYPFQFNLSSKNPLQT